MRPPSSGCWRTCLRFPARWPSWTPPTTWCAVPCAPARADACRARLLVRARGHGGGACGRHAHGLRQRQRRVSGRGRHAARGLGRARTRPGARLRPADQGRAQRGERALRRERRLALGVDARTVSHALAGFAPLEHRLEPCGCVAGVRCVNDSKATNVDATLKALAAFDDVRPVVLLGGRDKGTDLAPLVQAARCHAKAVVCFGEAAWRLCVGFSADAKRRRCGRLWFRRSAGRRTGRRCGRLWHPIFAFQALVACRSTRPRAFGRIRGTTDGLAD